MYRPTRVLAALLSLLVFGAQASGPAAAQVMKQMALTDQHITSFIAAQTDFAPLVVKLSEAADEPTDALKTELNDVAKKNGFASFDEYMDVNDNIAYVMGGLNRNTMEFTEPIERKKAEIASYEADKGIPKDEKDRAITYLNKEIAAMVPLQFKDNIEVVKRHFADLVKLLPDEGAGEEIGDEGDPTDDAGDGAVEGPVEGEPGEPVAE